MIAIIGPVDGERTQRPEALDAAPGLQHALAIRVRHGERARTIEQHIDGDAGPATVLEGIDDVL